MHVCKPMPRKEFVQGRRIRRDELGMKRSKKLREWLRAPHKKPALEGLGLLSLLTAVCAPVLYAMAYRNSFNNYGGFDERLLWISLAAAAAILAYFLCDFWTASGHIFEATLDETERTRFRLGHLMVLAAESFVLGWLLHEGRLAPTQAFQDLCRSVPLMVAVQVCYVLMGLVVAAKIQRAAEKEDWPDLEALVAVALMAPMVLVPVIGFALLVLLHGPGVLLLVPLAAMVLLPIVWLLGVVADESRRSLDRVKRERRNRARRQAKLKKPGADAEPKTELPDSLSAGK